MTLSGGALFANWKLFQFLSSLIVKVILTIFMGASAQLAFTLLCDMHIFHCSPRASAVLCRGFVFESCFEWDVVRGPGSSRAWSCRRFGGSRSAVFMLLSLRVPALWTLNPAIAAQIRARSLGSAAKCAGRRLAGRIQPDGITAVKPQAHQDKCKHTA